LAGLFKPMDQLKTEPQFLSDLECDWFIRLFDDNPIDHNQDMGNGPDYMAFTLDLYPLANRLYEVKYLISKLVRFCPIPEAFIEYFQVVRREVGNELTEHLDFDDVVYSSIIYLNDTFEGGETRVGETLIKPARGTIIGFEGAEVRHSVLPIAGNHRYAISTWYKTAEFRPDKAAARHVRTPDSTILRRPMFGRTE